jgi:hypothetical protein
MTYSEPAETTTAEMAKTVADEGWSVVGVLDRPLSRRLLRAVDEVAARSADSIAGGNFTNCQVWRSTPICQQSSTGHPSWRS